MKNDIQVLTKKNQVNENLGVRLSSIRDFQNENYTKSNNFLHKFFDELPLREVKIINSLLYIFSTYSKLTKNDVQKKELISTVFLNDGFFELNYQQLLKIMEIEKTDITIYEIRQILFNIKNTNLKYLKFKNGKSIQSYTSFITHFSIIRDEKTENNNLALNTTIRLHIDKELYEDIFNCPQIGYTLLSIESNKLQSKLANGMYEELKRITPLKQIRKSNDKYSITNIFKQIHSYSIDDLNEIRGTNYKHLSKFLLDLNKQYKKILNLNLLEDIYKFTIQDKKLYIEIVRPKFDNEDKTFEI